MCGPLSVWKWVIYVTSAILAMIGIAIMVVAIVAADKYFIRAIDMENLVEGYGIAFGVVFIIIGLVGWLSAKCESKCLVVTVLLAVSS